MNQFRPGVLTVYYDGGCPLCAREIDFYRRRRGADDIDWVDLAALSDPLVAPDLCRQTALARIHVRLPDGSLVSGARGFGALWTALPDFRWLGRLIEIKNLQPLWELLYRGFLRIRPALQGVARRVHPR